MSARRSRSERPTFEEVARLLYPPLSLGQACMARMVEGLDPATPEQERICERFLGRPWEPDLRVPRRRVVINAGRGSGKSLFGGLWSIHRASTCDLRGLAPGETPQIPYIGPKTQAGDTGFKFVRSLSGEGTPFAAEPGRVVSTTEKTLFVRRCPCGGTCRVCHGRFVRTQVVLRAADRAGVNVRGEPNAGLVLEEASLFYTRSDYVVTDRSVYEAAIPRFRSDAQALLVSSSWERSGLFYEDIERDHGRSRDALVIRVPHPSDVNPAYVQPPEIVPGSATERREVYNEFVHEGEGGVASDAQIARAAEGRTEEDVLAVRGVRYVDGLDWAGTGGDFTGYAIGHVEPSDDGTQRVVIDLVRGWPATVPPEQRVAHMATLRRRYAIPSTVPLLADQYSRATVDALTRALAGFPVERAELSLAEALGVVHAALEDGALSLPRSPLLMAQIPALHLRPRAGGGYTVADPPRDSRGGHCDEAIAVSVVVGRLRGKPVSKIRSVGTPDGNTRKRHVGGDDWGTRLALGLADPTRYG